MSAAGVLPADAAWVLIDTPLAPGALTDFCGDLERLYRINPYLVFRDWRQTGEGSFAAAFFNLSNQRDFDLGFTLERDSPRDFTVRYGSGLRRSTRFEIEHAPGGSRLKITDDYSGAIAGETGEVDRSLHAWGVAIREYLLREQRWGWCAPWRWYMRRIWVPMTPSARRMVFMVLVIAAAEMALTALVLAIYWIEYRD